MERGSGRVLGWSLGSSKDAKLTLSALNHAVHNRHPGAGLIFHSDRGIEYAAYAVRQRLKRLRLVQSMNRPGHVADNTFMESFFHSMKSDVIHGVVFNDEGQLRHVLRCYMPFYNGPRMHSSLGYRSPIDYERQPA